MDFSGKAALVVGGSSGIGNAVVRALRSFGAEVVVTGTRASAQDYEDPSAFEGLRYAALDVGRPGAVEAFEPGLSQLDILVLSQGIVRYKSAEFELDIFREVVEVNMTSVMACAMRFAALLEASKGALVIISSTAAMAATKGNPAYAASKSGAVGLTRTLGLAWASKGIRVNGVAPGIVPTKMTSITTEHPGRREAAEARVPLGRLGTPEEIANVALFLASPLSSYVVGQTIIVDGGALL